MIYVNSLMSPLSARETLSIGEDPFKLWWNAVWDLDYMNLYDFGAKNYSQQKVNWCAKILHK